VANGGGVDRGWRCWAASAMIGCETRRRHARRHDQAAHSTACECVTARSICLHRVRRRVNLPPKTGATAWKRRTPDPGGGCRTRRTAAGHAGRDIFEQPQPFCAMYRTVKPVALPPGGQARDETGADRVEDSHEHDRARCGSPVRNGAAVAVTYQPRGRPARARQFRRVCTNVVGRPSGWRSAGCGVLQPIASGPCERREAGLVLRIVRGQIHEHADAQHPLACWARAASGHACRPAEPVMNSRRFTWSTSIGRPRRGGAMQAVTRTSAGCHSHAP